MTFRRCCDDCGDVVGDVYTITTAYSSLDAPVCEPCLAERGLTPDDDRVEQV